MDMHEIRDILRNDVATVIFTKRNGEERTMMCTLMPEYLPEMEVPNSDQPPSETSATVWDIEVDQWRAFRYDSLISIETDEISHVF